MLVYPKKKYNSRVDLFYNLKVFHKARPSAFNILGPEKQNIHGIKEKSTIQIETDGL
jgi:hypothetical protein